MSAKQSLQGDKNQNIKVYVRCRPINEQERKARSQMCVDVSESRKSITVKSHHERTFTFDGTFGKDSTQIDVYKSVVQPLISEVLQGYNCTVFAYGQTGTGKTYTMEGVRSQTLLSWQHDPHAGVVPRALHQIFSEVGDPELTIIKVSFLELYNEELFDLLGSGEATTSKLKIFEDSTAKGSVVVRGLEEVVVRDRQEVYSLMERGASRRQVAATLMNASSSRSHTIFTITVISRDTADTGENLMRTGKLNLVDLAGSENIGRSGAQDKRAREAGNINQSLLTLGRVITALVERTPHVPYRESKLTRLLQDSLGGRTKTSIIATISPAHVNLDETHSTLEYAFRAKNIMNRPEVNQKLCEEVVIKHMTDEMEQLRRDLRACREKNGIYIDELNYKSMQSRLDLQSEELQRNAEEMIEMAKRIDSLKTDIDVLQQLSRDTSERLEMESRSKERAQTRLKEVNYKYTAAKVLVKAHQQTEEKLHQDASKLIDTALLAKSDTHKLHEKVQRQREVESHNSVIINELNAILNSSLDSSVRRADDALATLSKSCSLKDETLKGLREEIGLLQDVDCLLGKILEKHLAQRKRVLEDISRINNMASESIERLGRTEKQFDDSLRRALSGVTSKLCLELTEELAKMKSSLLSEVDHVAEVAAKNGRVVNQHCGRLETIVDSVKTSSQSRAARAQEESKAMEAKQAKIHESLKQLNDDISRRLKQVNEDINEVFTPQTKFLEYTVENSKDDFERSIEASGVIRELIESHDQASGEIVSHVANIKSKVGECAEKQQTISRACVENIESDFTALQGVFSDSTQRTKENLTELLRTGKETASTFKADSSASVKDLSTLASSVLSGSQSIYEAKGNLFTLRERVTEMINRNMKTCPVTGTTPARRNYEIPRSLARTQPADLLQAKLQKKFEEATIEERLALDEGQSMILDVTASPEMLDFDSEDEKENVLLGIENSGSLESPF